MKRKSFWFIALLLCLLTLSMSGTAHAAARQWKVVPSPNSAENNGSLSSIAFTPEGNAWSVGYAYTDGGQHFQSLALYRSARDQQWKVVPTPQFAGGSSVLSSVVALSENNAWAVGSYTTASGQNQPLVLHWDGSSWQRVKSPTPGQGSTGTELNSITAISANNIWAAGSYFDGTYTRTLVEHWDGKAWQLVQSPNVETAQDSTNKFRSIVARSAKDIWAVGEAAPPIPNSKPMLQHWDGKKWQVVPYETTESGRLLSVTALSKNDVWAIGQTYQGPGEPLTLHWDGKQWTRVESPSRNEISGLYGAVALAKNDVWAVGFSGSFDGETLAMHWDGKQWTIVETPRPDETGGSLHAVALDPATNNLWAVGFSNMNSISPRTLTMLYS
uniref:Photosynthesis system II assembly factor Ycf48/Hcf136-like domain-containing protein n=1 Tax=Thermosporothrix sp. COM3 TaxID=2490863 RepID=A0A455SFR4_9CHLR|nr:hypothetical protein KTC_05830 [Thermosporothrix sp. COM3]